MAKPKPLADYDPSRVTMQIGDIEPQAYGPDTRISITPSAPGFSVTVGQDGHVQRNKNRAVTYQLTFTLMKGDPANDKLTALYYKDMESEDGEGIVDLNVTDGNGTSKCSSSQCWVTTLPPMTYSAAGEQYEWTLDLGSADYAPGSFTAS